jgi:DNA-binding CsgD family transcriptional regulator
MVVTCSAELDRPMTGIPLGGRDGHADDEGEEQMLLGRDRECRRVAGLVNDAAAGRGSCLVVRGEPGIGKTALLDYAAEQASSLQVLRAVGVASEMELPYAALHQICARLLGRIGELPAPQADALGIALGDRTGEPPDPYLVGLSLLGLLSRAAADTPILCLVDDAQWIDGSSLLALGFLARRLEGSGIGELFATRSEMAHLAGLPELVVPGLAAAAARRLLATIVPGRLDYEVRDRIVAETRGNPLALIELPRGRDPAELAGGFGVPASAGLSSFIEERFLSRVQALPEATELFLLLAAAEPLGDPSVLWRAAGSLGIGAADAAPAERVDLLRIGARATFHHPLVRSAVYRSAPTDQRLRVHRALAEATDVQTDPDRRAWHRALGTVGKNDEVAEDLERGAGRARARGGPAAAAAFLEVAASFSADPGHRALLLLESAELKYQAGAPLAAAELLGAVDTEHLGELAHARQERLDAQVQLSIERGTEPALLLMRAARRLEGSSLALARKTYLDALAAGMLVGPGRLGEDWHALARAVRCAPRPAPPERASDLLLEGIAVQVLDGYAAALPLLRRALRAFLEEGSTGEDVDVLWLACRSAMNLWDDGSLCSLSELLSTAAREAGLVVHVRSAISVNVAVALLTGDLDRAVALGREAQALSELSDSDLPVYPPLAIAAWQGHPWPPTAALPTRPRGDGLPDASTQVIIADFAVALGGNGLGRYGEAMHAAKRAAQHSAHLGYALWALPELVEAACRCGVLDLAHLALGELSASTEPSGSDWALGVEARCRALLAGDDVAEPLYQESIEHLEATRITADLARAHLVYGEWLRRANRRVDAREQLRTAIEMLTAMGASGFASRAKRELAATGERARPRSGGPNVALTPQEAEIARLVSEGHSNAEIGAQLFISTRTVEYHLHKVFMKLGLRSRGQLARAMAVEEGHARA